MRASAQVDAARRVAVAIGHGNSVFGPIRPAQLDVTSFHQRAVWSPSPGADVQLAWLDRRQNQPVEYRFARVGSMADPTRLAGEPDVPVLRAYESVAHAPASGRIDVRGAEETGEITARVSSEVVEGYPEPGLPTLHDFSHIGKHSYDES